MLEIKDLSISINDRYLVKHLSLTLNKKDKLAIIGEEGNGKSTLLKAILGICEYARIEGSINYKNNKIGYLEQSLIYSGKVFDFIFDSEEDYYSKTGDLYKYLDVFNLKESVLDKRINSLSGGEKVKIGLLKLLLNKCDILLLDEPTNDLDIKTLEWLETFINSAEIPIIYVSHDETLLSNTASSILHLEQINDKTECRHTLLKIDYDTYVNNRIRKLEKQTQIAKSEKREYRARQEKLQRIMQKVEYQQNNISRSDPHGAQVLKKKMHSLKSQEKKLKNTILTDIPDVEEGINFFFEDVKIPNNKVIIELHIPTLAVNNIVLAKNIKLDIRGNEHICIIGQNGVGKSTLLKYIYNELKDRDDIIVGYMPQNYSDSLDMFDKVLDYICPNKSKENITKARTLLSAMNITPDEMTSKIEYLSNGTKAKLLLAKLVLDKCNVLILDEPTRNVSPLSNPIIRSALKTFNGTIISVSHDRKYLSEVINKLYELTFNGLNLR